jgi:hypothetical protein
MEAVKPPKFPEVSRFRERRYPVCFPEISRSSYIAAGKRETGTGPGVVAKNLSPGAIPKPGAKAMTAAELERIYCLRARGLNAATIAARLGLDVAQERAALDPTSRPKGLHL